MSSFNTVSIMGHLGKAPETKSLKTGLVAEFSVAVTDRWTTNGEKKERTDWFDIVCYGKLAEICQKYLTKGKQVLISGSLRQETWESNDGGKRSKVKIIAREMQMLGSPDKPGTGNQTSKVPF